MTSAFTQGSDGWIYACHGLSNTSTVSGTDGRSITMHSDNTYLMRPDGSRLKWFTNGQVNPSGIANEPLGNLFTCECHSKPIYQLLRGTHYPSLGKAHDGLGFGLAMMGHDHGSTGIGGIAYYSVDHFPKPWRDTIFIGNVLTSRINHDRLKRHGLTLQAVMQPDFLVSDDPWLRPVDIILGPEGAPSGADFYNRIISYYEVPLTHLGRDRERGRIQRIIYRGQDGKSAPRPPRADWTRAKVDELIADLEHPNLVVRLRSTDQLATRPDADAGPAILRAMSKTTTPWTKSHGLRALERRGGLPEDVLKGCAEDPDAEVRVHAMRILSERPGLTTAQHDLLFRTLKNDGSFVQRAAADAPGRHLSAVNLQPLLALRHATPKEDTYLLHAVRMALRDRPGTPWTRPIGAMSTLEPWPTRPLGRPLPKPPVSCCDRPDVGWMTMEPSFGSFTTSPASATTSWSCSPS